MPRLPALSAPLLAMFKHGRGWATHDWQGPCVLAHCWVSTSAPLAATRVRPTEPEPDDCCGRGCAECVWTSYWEELKAFETQEAAAQGRQRALDPFELLERRLGREAADLQQSPAKGAAESLASNGAPTDYTSPLPP